MDPLKSLSRSRALIPLVVVLLLALSGAAFAVTREAALLRGEVWVAKKVPYSQSRYAYTSGSLVSASASDPSRIGWRTDCSGFASMCLGLVRSDGTPLSLDTATLPSRLTKITKTDLKPGDIILRPKNLVIDGKQVPYGHAVVFVRWVDAAKTTYIGYHQSSSKNGTVAQEITYPFFGDKGYSPYRYKQIEDVRLRKSRTWMGPLAPTTTFVPATPSASERDSAEESASPDASLDPTVPAAPGL